MISHRRSLAVFVFLFLCVAMLRPSAAHAAFVWSPQTGWVGPSGAVKDTPADQFAYAQQFFDRRDFKKARAEFKKLVKRYPNAREAADGQYYIGRCYEEEGDIYRAYQAYRKTIQTYPSTTRFQECLERMYELGNAFLAGKKYKVFGKMAILPARDKAVEIFQAVVEDGPFSQYGELAQYKLGLAHLALGEYEQAVSAFEQLIARDPNSTLVDDARFQLTQASLKGTFRPGYDQHPTEQALSELETFLEEYPSSELAPQALERLQVLRERRAQHDYMVAQYYERRKKPDSALIYYEDIVNRHPQTVWAEKSAARIQILEPLALPTESMSPSTYTK